MMGKSCTPKIFSNRIHHHMLRNQTNETYSINTHINNYELYYLPQNHKLISYLTKYEIECPWQSSFLRSTKVEKQNDG